MQVSILYNGARSIYLVSDADNKEILRKIVLETCKGLKGVKKMNKVIKDNWRFYYSF